MEPTSKPLVLTVINSLSVFISSLVLQRLPAREWCADICFGCVGWLLAVPAGADCLARSWLEQLLTPAATALHAWHSQALLQAMQNVCSTQAAHLVLRQEGLLFQFLLVIRQLMRKVQVPKVMFWNYQTKLKV